MPSGYETYKPRNAKGNSPTVSVVLPPDLAEWLAQQTILEKKSQSQIVRRALMRERDYTAGLPAISDMLDYMTPDGPV